MKISVVIPAFNEEKLLPKTLSNLAVTTSAFTEAGWEYEIIVCDNNSRDRTAQIAAELGAKVVFEPVNQIARARNSGAGAATGEWLLFVDADSEPSKELLSQVIATIEKGNVIGGGSIVEFDQVRGALARLLVATWNLVSRVARLCAGSFIFVEAKAFREIGGFSHELYVSEEIEFTRRLKVYGKKLGKKVVILHRYPLKTSARKFDLYSPGAMLRFFLRGFWRPRKTIRDREACFIWYDGKR